MTDADNEESAQDEESPDPEAEGTADPDDMDDMDDQHSTPGSEDSASDAEDSTVGDSGTAEDISTKHMSTISVTTGNPDDMEEENSAITVNCSRLLLMVTILILL